MPAGYDEGSPAKQYADNYRKARAEIVERFREIVNISMADWPDMEIELGRKMDKHGFTLEKLIS